MAAANAHALWEVEKRLTKVPWHVDALIEEGVITRRDVQTLTRVRRRLSDRGRIARWRRADDQP